MARNPLLETVLGELRRLQAPVIEIARTRRTKRVLFKYQNKTLSVSVGVSGGGDPRAIKNVLTDLHRVIKSAQQG